MLTRWILENFKPIRDRVDLPIAPLTVLAGLNSSGKSSLLQSILLVAQTLSNQRVDEPLVLNGPLVRLGTFQDVCNDRAAERRITIGFTLEGVWEEASGQAMTPAKDPLATTNRMVVDFEGEPATEAESTGISAARVEVRRMEMTVSSSSRPPGRKHPSPWTTRLFAQRVTLQEEAEMLRGLAEPALRSLPHPPGQGYLATIGNPDMPATDERAFLGLSHFVPDRFVVRGRSLLATLRAEVILLLQRLIGSDARDGQLLSAIRSLLPLYWLNSPRYAEPMMLPPDDVHNGLQALAADASLPAFEGSTPEAVVMWLSGLPRERMADSALLERLTDILMPINPSELEEALRDNLNVTFALPLTRASQNILHTFTSTIRYLGPLRAEPHAIQSFSPTGQLDDVGPRGEYAAAVYAANRKHPVRHVDPITGQIETRPLEAAMDVWLRYLGVADHVGTREAAVPGVSWLVRSAPAERERPLGAVGVGVSQLLPILVSGLLAPEGSILIMEQPELHLHERPQARLGDFFYGLTRVGKQVLIETHSAVLIGQLRYHMVQQGQARDAIAIYFVSQDTEGQARFDPIRISRRGAIENWPDGFFDESFRQEDRITQEGLRHSAAR